MNRYCLYYCIQEESVISKIIRSNILAIELFSCGEFVASLDPLVLVSVLTTMHLS